MDRIVPDLQGSAKDFPALVLPEARGVIDVHQRADPGQAEDDGLGSRDLPRASAQGQQ